MPIPKVAIVGRPNVGKSSIFIWLIGQRVSIVDPTAGVTRDRVSFLLDLNDEEETPQLIKLIDTSGIGIVDEDNLSEREASLSKGKEPSNKCLPLSPNEVATISHSVRVAVPVVPHVVVVYSAHWTVA